MHKHTFPRTPETQYTSTPFLRALYSGRLGGDLFSLGSIHGMMRPSLITLILAAALHVTEASRHCSHLLEEKQQEIDHLTAELEVCRAPSPTPTPPTPTPTPTEPLVTSTSGNPFTCDGILNGQICCRQECGSCGGVGCSDRGGGLTGDDCCVSNIEEHGALCSVAGQAPCFVDGELMSCCVYVCTFRRNYL